jgi:hypothetical protein
MMILKIVLSALFGLAGCKTDFDTSYLSILKGMESDHIEVILKRQKIRYHYLTCDELKNKPSNIKQGCTTEDSLGAYVGWINKGAYILGMGSTDVYFEVEISKDKKGLGVYIDEIHTFL